MSTTSQRCNFPIGLSGTTSISQDNYAFPLTTYPTKIFGGISVTTPIIVLDIEGTDTSVDHCFNRLMEARHSY